MRIAYVCADPGVPVFGRKGCSVHVQEVVRAFRRLNHDVTLLATRIGGEVPENLADLSLLELPPVESGPQAQREQAALAANRGLADGLESAGPFDLVYERHSLWSYAAMEFARQVEIPGLLEVNSPLIEEQVQYRGLVHEDLARRTVERSFRTATVLLAVSQGVAQRLGEWGADDKIHIVPNGVDPTRFDNRFRTDSSADADTFTVGFLGTLKPWHGVTTLLDSCARALGDIPGLRLLIVGDGPLRPTIESDLSRLGIEHISKLTGAIAPTDVPEYLARMDVAVAPYPSLEGFYFSPLKLFEYMAARKAIVATALGQIEEIIVQDVNGLLCPPDDAGALAEALVRLHEDADLRKRLGEEARRTIERDHTWDGVAQRILALAGTHRVNSLAVGGTER
ncbi:MAG: glycosyltransferase family 4 protein [Phycisphaerales bacterium]|nr:MAG: glycosyltransferase family 4 protein [Phycisphaerales bacterium]